ncbi:MAG: hypothetical protein UZ13_00132, partial [Chloroflexi bacterium OLB13]
MKSRRRRMALYALTTMAVDRLDGMASGRHWES